MQRSGAITPRRAACARSKREVCVGKRSVTWRAISAPVAVMPMKIGPRPAADRGAGLLAQRGVRLVADDDRVGVGDLAGVAHEPLVGLDRDRAVRRGPCPSSSGRRDAVGVAAVAQLAVELVDEVAAVGEDQDAAGARGLDEAERGDRLAGAGGVLEPEALGGVRDRRAPRRAASSSSLLVLVPVASARRARPPPRSSSSSRVAASGASCRSCRSATFPGRRSGRCRCRCRRWTSASRAVSVPDSAST